MTVSLGEHVTKLIVGKFRRLRTNLSHPANRTCLTLPYPEKVFCVAQLISALRLVTSFLHQTVLGHCSILLLLIPLFKAALLAWTTKILIAKPKPTNTNSNNNNQTWPLSSSAAKHRHHKLIVWMHIFLSLYSPRYGDLWCLSSSEGWAVIIRLPLSYLTLTCLHTSHCAISELSEEWADALCATSNLFSRIGLHTCLRAAFVSFPF